MTIFVNSDTRVIVQGMTGAEGRKHTQRMLSSGTTIVGGTNPRKAGTTVTFDVQGYGPGADKVTDGQVEIRVRATGETIVVPVEVAVARLREQHCAALKGE